MIIYTYLQFYLLMLFAFLGGGLFGGVILWHYLTEMIGGKK